MASVEQPAASNDELVIRLEESEARYASLISRGGYGSYRSSPAGRFLTVNATLATMLGYDEPAAVLSLDLAHDVYLDPDERARLITQGPSRTDDAEWVDTRWKRRDGSPINVRISVWPHHHVDGTVLWWDGIVQDITERQRHEELRRRSERMASIGTTLAGVAHELNNPLAAIMGFAQLLLRKAWPAEDRAALETINHEAIRSATIVKDLLAMARKRDHERRVRTDINDVVGYIARTRRYALETAGVSCRLSLDPTLPPVFSDRTQLEQVILNLINNAEHALTDTDDATGTRGHIQIRTHHDADDVIIDVEDDGPGIPDAVRAHIWDPFWTTKDEGKGTGLGLAVVHGIIADHGGTITLENTPRSGACFVIRLPIARDAGNATVAGQASRPLDVLVVDPGASDLMFVERFLTSRGHAVINAGSGELALRLANQGSFDAVVCDANLLGRDGIPVAAALRRAPACTDARFVLSVQSADGQHPTSVIPGAEVVARPYDVEELRRLIEGD
jgi:PAS domain S-box-containing protein